MKILQQVWCADVETAYLQLIKRGNIRSITLITAENVPLGLNFPILTVSLCEIKEGNYWHIIVLNKD